MAAVILIVILIFCVSNYRNQGLYSVAEVFDGDTISVNMAGVVEKVRLIGVDTPETKDPRKLVQCYGPEASAFSHTQLEHAKVKLQTDPLSTNRDRYNRLLRYVYLQDGRSYNLLLLQNGFARAYTGFPFTKSGQYTIAANSAASAKTGLWASCPPQ